MADVSDVRDTLKSIIAGAIYPSGTGQPSAILQGAAHVPVGIVAGWPLKDQIQADIAAGVATVSIFPYGSERLTTRFPRMWTTLAPPVTTITAVVTDTTVTFGGSVSSPQNICVLAGGKSYLYAVQPGDTLSTIAAALAALIPGASSVGPVLTVPAAVHLTARIGGQGRIVRELERQERIFQITIWCGTPEQRDAVAPFVDLTLKGAGRINGREFITLPDGCEGRLTYQRSLEIDTDQLAGIFRRDLLYCVEYATTEIIAAAAIVTNTVNLTEGQPLGQGVTTTFDF